MRGILFPVQATEQTSSNAPPIPADQLLTPLLRAGMTVSLLVNGRVIPAQKIVTINDGLLFTVDAQGLVTVTRIDRIDSLTY